MAEIIEEQPVSAFEALSAGLPGVQPQAAPVEEAAAAVAENPDAAAGQAAVEQVAAAQEAGAAPVEGAPAAAAPQPDPAQELMAKIAALEEQNSKLQLDDNAKKILAIANGGPEAIERYLTLKNTDFNQMSLLDKLQAQFMEDPMLEGRTPEQKRNIFFDSMMSEFPNFDPTDPDLGYPPDTGARFRMDKRAAEWTDAQNKRREQELLNFEAPKGPEPFTDEDHTNYGRRVADAYTNLKTVSFQDLQGNQFDIPVGEIPDFDNKMKSDFLAVGPAAWLDREVTDSDDKGRRIVHPEKAMKLVAKVSAIPALISKVAADTEARVRRELGQEKEAAMKSVVDETLGIAGKGTPAPQRAATAAEQLLADYQSKVHTT